MRRVFQPRATPSSTLARSFNAFLAGILYLRARNPFAAAWILVTEAKIYFFSSRYLTLLIWMKAFLREKMKSRNCTFFKALLKNM